MFRKNELEEPKEKNNEWYMKKEGRSNILSHKVIGPWYVVDFMLFIGCDGEEFNTKEIIKFDTGYSLNQILNNYFIKSNKLE